MSTHVSHLRSAALSYCAEQWKAHARQALIWTIIVAVHAAVILLLLLDHGDRTPRIEQAVTVSFITEQRPEQPQSRLPEPPKLIQPMIATRDPVPLPIVTTPSEEAITQAVQSEASQPVATAGPQQEAIVPPDYSAAYLNNPGPKYPDASRRRREQGLVLLRVFVSATGVPEQVLIDQSSGFASLDEAAADVVRKRWRFEPATQDAQAVSAWVVIPMSFSLKNR